MIKKEEAISRGYSEEKDHRCLSDVRKFLPGGTHRAFVELVENHRDELAFCFRGNNRDKETVVIYYKNHIAFVINAKGDVAFDFNHARYMEDWRIKKEELERWGYTFVKHADTFKRTVYKYPSGEVRDSYSIGTATMASERAAALTPDGLEQLYQNSIKVMIESYFNANRDKKYDCFREAVTGKKQFAKALREKIAQQKLFLACKSLKGYFIYDMEFSQPCGKALKCENQPDMLAVRFDRHGEPVRLVSVEVKSTKHALNGKSGVRSHVYGMESYPDWLLPIRGRDAYRIFDQYAKLGLLKELPDPLIFTEEKCEKLPKEVLLVFTGQDTITALGKAKAGGKEPVERFLLDMGYERVCSKELPQLSLDGKHPEPIVAYRKDF